jgi:hypothetical protein
MERLLVIAANKLEASSEAHVTPSNVPGINPQTTLADANAKPKERRQPVTTSTPQKILKASSLHAVRVQAPPAALPNNDADASLAAANPAVKKPQPVTESISQKLWNDAYESLEKDEDKLIKAYVKTLAKVLEAEKATDGATSGAYDVSDHLKDLNAKRVADTSVAGAMDILAELKDRTNRQAYMKELVKKGKACRSCISSFGKKTWPFKRKHPTIEQLVEQRSITDRHSSDATQTGVPKQPSHPMAPVLSQVSD